jgi:hypothetical protein
MSHWRIAVLCFLVFALLAIPFAGCGGKKGAKVVIRVGELTDLTGPAGPALKWMTTSMDDLVKYLNENQFIPGAEIKMFRYDTQMDPSKAIIGWEWLQGRGVDVVFCPLPQIAEVIKPFAERDKLPVVSVTTTIPQIEPPGWVFCVNWPGKWGVPTVMNWIAEHDWTKYPTKPKVAVVGWSEPGGNEMNQAMKEYCQAYPENFEYAGGYLAPVGEMMWSSQARRVKDCDYVWMGVGGAAGAGTFIRDLRATGSAATSVSVENQITFKNTILSYIGSTSFDGTIGATTGGYLTDPFPIMDLVGQLAHQYHDSATAAACLSEEAYTTGTVMNQACLNIVQAAATEVGANNLDGQAIYEAAKSFKSTFEGYPENAYAFSENDRCGVHFARIYEYKDEQSDFVAVSDWIPILRQ